MQNHSSHNIRPNTLSFVSSGLHSSGLVQREHPIASEAKVSYDEYWKTFAETVIYGPETLWSLFEHVTVKRSKGKWIVEGDIPDLQKLGLIETLETHDERYLWTRESE